MLSLSSRSKPIIHHDFCEVKEINPIGKRETNEIRDSTGIYFFYQPKSYRFKFPLLVM